MKKMSKKGFTLVEIMIVVLIIGLLAAIAIPSFVRARETSRAKTCTNNLRLVDAAVEQWAMENNATTGATPNDDDALQFLKGNVMPACPSSGTEYTWPTVGTVPTCPSTGVTPNADNAWHAIPAGN